MLSSVSTKSLALDEKNPTIAVTLRRRADEYLNRGLYIKKELKSREKKQVSAGGEGEAKDKK